MGFEPRLYRQVRESLLLPIALTILVALPGIGFDFFWDDFFFLTRFSPGSAPYLLPRIGETFYRPIPQGLYFGLLGSLGDAAPVLGHLFNLTLLAVATGLLAWLVVRLAGPRAGLLAGAVFATSAALPGLVAWVSASQDLLAMVFILGALHLRHSGKIGASAAAAACALLSKETAAVLIPVLVFWDELLGRRPSRIKTSAIAFGVILVAWMALHPGIRALAAAGFRSGTTGYVGLERPERWWEYLIRYLLLLFNIPFTGSLTTWPGRLTPVAVVGALTAILGIPWALERVDAAGAHSSAPDSGTVTPDRLMRVAYLLALPPLLLPSIFVRPWASYFAAIAMPGFAFLVALPLSRARPMIAATLVAAYLLLGIWCRGMDSPGNGRVITEQRFADASRATKTVRDHFRELAPELPRGARVLLSVAGTGTMGINQTLHSGQALRLWYHDPTLETVQPEWARKPGPEELLVRVTPDLQVLEIDPGTSRFRSKGDYPDREEIAKPIRSFARGLAASGATAQAVWLLDHMATVDSVRLRSYDLRLAAQALHAVNREEEAERHLSEAPPLSRTEALDMAGKVFAEPTGNPHLDSLAFWPFGVSPDDPDALRYLIGQYRIGGYWKPAHVLAERLLRVLPSDSLARAALRFNPLAE